MKHFIEHQYQMALQFDIVLRMIILSVTAKKERAPVRQLLCFDYPSTSATATSLTLVPVGPVTIRPPMLSSAW